MIEIYNNFVSNNESNQLIEYYKSNISKEYTRIDDIYNFKAVDVLEYNAFSIHNKLKLISPVTIRVQLVDESISVTEYSHSHTIPWTYLVFLNDNFEGGELEIENIKITPKKNQLIVFPGNLKHRVLQVTGGSRYTLVSFTNTKCKVLNSMI